ncbi:Trypsin-1 [Araneus ventricosus]|uniref:Trypsin-1 n=1 Tax=Araneus ventricosus TaxID=182803 RepID=A0A4Y2B905_ARAVE|nr:Trypsin-1 [Araneus ventricosus]
MLGALLIFLITQQFALLKAKPADQVAVFDRIVGGEKAEENEFLFQASLQRKSKWGYFHTCGAALITDEWLLTAAHCIKLNSTSWYKIMIGSSKLKPIDAENFYSIQMIIIKQGFDDHTFINDIALIQLTEPVRSLAEPIKLPDFAPDLNISATVIGWGATAAEGKQSNDLLKAEVALISLDDCLDFYREIAETSMCAGYAEGGRDACQGDSGGPLIQTRNGETFLIGIVSWGIGCAEPKQPGVYTDVSLFNAWIKHYVAFG